MKENKPAPRIDKERFSPLEPHEIQHVDNHWLCHDWKRQHQELEHLQRYECMGDEDELSRVAVLISQDVSRKAGDVLARLANLYLIYRADNNKLRKVTIYEHAMLTGVMERIAHGVEDGQSFSGTDCAALAKDTLSRIEEGSSE